MQISHWFHIPFRADNCLNSAPIQLNENSAGRYWHSGIEKMVLPILDAESKPDWNGANPRPKLQQKTPRILAQPQQKTIFFSEQIPHAIRFEVFWKYQILCEHTLRGRFRIQYQKTVVCTYPYNTVFMHTCNKLFLCYSSWELINW